MLLFSKVLLLWVLGCSLLCFFLCGVDKYAAKNARWRIPERRFFIVAFLGGGLGLWLGMQCFRHKTLHRSFWVVAVGSTCIYLAAFLLVALKIAEKI